MVSLIVVFWMYVVLFAIIGAMRGWAREMLVSFAVILGLFILNVMERFVPFISTTLGSLPTFQFWYRTATIVVLVFFGYQTPNLRLLSSESFKSRFARERLQDILLGVFLGAFNGYLIVGSIWFYLDAANYPFPNLISAPTDQVAVVTERMMALMAPDLLGGSPAIYFAVALAFAFILVVFI